MLLIFLSTTVITINQNVRRWNASVNKNNINEIDNILYNYFCKICSHDK